MGTLLGAAGFIFWCCLEVSTVGITGVCYLAGSCRRLIYKLPGELFLRSMDRPFRIAGRFELRFAVVPGWLENHL